MTQISERLLVQAHLDAKQPNPLTAEQEAEYRAAIAAELKAQNAVLVAHYYCDPVIQRWPKKPVVAYPTRWKWPVSARTTLLKP